METEIITCPFCAVIPQRMETISDILVHPENATDCHLGGLAFTRNDWARRPPKIQSHVEVEVDDEKISPKDLEKTIRFLKQTFDLLTK